MIAVTGAVKAVGCAVTGAVTAVIRGRDPAPDVTGTVPAVTGRPRGTVGLAAWASTARRAAVARSRNARSRDQRAGLTCPNRIAPHARSQPVLVVGSRLSTSLSLAR